MSGNLIQTVGVGTGVLYLPGLVGVASGVGVSNLMGVPNTGVIGGSVGVGGGVFVGSSFCGSGVRYGRVGHGVNVGISVG